MEKVFEALNEIVEDLVTSQEALDRIDNTSQRSKDFFKKWVREHKTIIETALKELEQIKEAKPSEAMEKFNDLMYLMNKTGIEKIVEDYSATIKATLLKAQEQEKENAEYKEVLRIIFEKNVDVDMIKNYQTVIEYNWNIRFEKYKRKELTKEEFIKNKRWNEK